MHAHIELFTQVVKLIFILVEIKNVENVFHNFITWDIIVRDFEFMILDIVFL